MCLRCPTSQPFGPRKVPSQGEIFTFDTESLSALSRYQQPSRSSKRPRRILYPATGRRYLPPPQRDHIKSCLLLLCAVVALQIYSEQPAPLAGEGELSGTRLPQQDSPAGGLPFNSSQTAQSVLDNTLKAMGCSYLELYKEATALRL
ncbi:radiation-inducible immediate-early gene IEX-1-like [Scyliorhinus torazame]|uniref:radiation-inducible immediate-early gene IEX-1-like n=1 Tax=Scyliorhinus torazame TaxID=75743 RepID=UPI003B5CBC92